MSLWSRIGQAMAKPAVMNAAVNMCLASSAVYAATLGYVIVVDYKEYKRTKLAKEKEKYYESMRYPDHGQKL